MLRAVGRAPRSLWHWTPLHWAARLGAADAVALLLDAGADPKMKGKPWRSPLLRQLKGFPGMNGNPCQIAALGECHEARAPLQCTRALSPFLTHRSCSLRLRLPLPLIAVDNHAGVQVIEVFRSRGITTSFLSEAPAAPADSGDR